jgi:hypothetical protein
MYSGPIAANMIDTPWKAAVCQLNSTRLVGNDDGLQRETVL